MSGNYPITKSKETLGRLHLQIQFSCEKMISHFERLFCKEKNYDVEVLVNNAGYGIESQFHKTSMEVEEKFIRVLGTSVIALCKAFIPDMLEKNQVK